MSDDSQPEILDVPEIPAEDKPVEVDPLDAVKRTLDSLEKEVAKLKLENQRQRDESIAKLNTVREHFMTARTFLEEPREWREKIAFSKQVFTRVLNIL